MSRTRLLEARDAEALAAVLVRSRTFLEPWEPVRPDHYFTVEGQADAVGDSLRRHAEGTMLPHVIVDDDGAVVGRINLNNIVRGPFQSASVGYWLAEGAGGRGLATGAVAELVRIAFTEQGLHRVEAGTIPENFRSQMVLRRNGFTQFGYAPRYLNIAGAWADHLLFQKLADE
ncbi:MAG: GNAT family N-acetyltransferase [Propionibacteriaceae bacterium]|nr:GNAT family N-acetyltransferase [Propionibacteriaceae bacterium]